MANGNFTDSRRRRRGGGTLLRALRWLAFLPVASRAPTYARLIWALSLDPRVPASRKAVLAGALGYVLVGRDLLPDDIPLLGGIDDVVVVVLAVEMFLDAVPADVLDEKIDELHIDREAFRRDMDEVRRLTPAPVRRFMRSLPELLEVAGRLVKESGIGPRIKSLISNKEESLA